MTQQEITKENFEKARKTFKVTAQKMSDNLEKWVIQKGGSIDTETGNVLNLSPTDESLFEFRNGQLLDLHNFDKSIEDYVKALRMSIAELTQSNTLLRGGRLDENLSYISDETIKENASIYYKFTIQPTTTKNEFRRACNQMRKWTDEAQKRLLFESPEIEAKYIAKRNAAVMLLQDEDKMKTFFDNKIKAFMQNDNSANTKQVTPVH